MSDEPLVLFPEDTTPYLPVGSITIAAPDLLRALVAVVHAAATDDERPILAAVAIQPRETADAVRLIASDNYRIAMCDVDAELEAVEDWHATVPAAVEDVRRLVAVLKSIPDIRTDECAARVVLTLGRRDTESAMGAPLRLDALVDDETPIARLPLRVIDGLYPNTAVLIPAAPEHLATFSSQYLSEAAKFGGAADPDGGGLIRQARSGADGPFVFASGRYLEIVMPVKTASTGNQVAGAVAERISSDSIGDRVAEAIADTLGRVDDPDAHDAAVEAARRLLSPIDGTSVSVTYRGRTIAGPGREVDPETGEILGSDPDERLHEIEVRPDHLRVLASDEGQAALRDAARKAAGARRKPKAAS